MNINHSVLIALIASVIGWMLIVATIAFLFFS